jgi:hypothetical protein
MKKIFMVTALAVLSGCQSVFPAATTDWGHGARAMDKGDVAVALSVGGGAGASIAAFDRGTPKAQVIAGGGGSAMLEAQVTQKTMVRLEAGVAHQVPGPLENPSVTPLAVYGGAQISMTPQFALRLRGGAGAEIIAGLPFPYGAADFGGVYSFFGEGPLDLYVEGHAGFKGIYSFLTIVGPSVSGGGSVGVNYEIVDDNQLYAGLHGDAVFSGFLSPTGNLQVGFRHVF